MVKKAIVLGVFLLGLLSAATIYLLRARVVVADSVQGKIRPYAEQLAAEINRRISGEFGKTYTLYTTNFDSGDMLPPLFQPEKNSILWMGSLPAITPDIQPFDMVMASTPLLVDFLQANEDKAFYLPLFTSQIDIVSGEKKFIALIGEPEFAENVLQRLNLPYRKYRLEQEDDILRDMVQFQAVIAENTAFSKRALDLHPIFFTLAAQKIPLAAFWGWPNVQETLNLFNDDISFYIDEADAERLIKALVSSPLPDDIAKRVQNARRLVKNEYSLKRAADELVSVMKNGRNVQTKPVANSLNLDLPVAVGHTASGDFWLAQDLAVSLNKNGWNTALSYFNSFFKYRAAVNILMRGFLSVQPCMVGDVNIFYLAYPQFGEEVSQKVLDDVTAFYEESAKELAQYDAVATASESLARALNERGVKAYYIPQFTNTERFYPDYDEQLKSEVLFVGRNAPYRRAAQIALEHKLPITIYGPHWGNDAKGEFINNRDLPKYYSAAKIILNDSRPEMLVHGVISNRIFDGTACGTLVISDYMPEIEAIYGDSVPMWKTEKELVNLIKYYLDPKHEEERLEKAQRAREITLKNFTAKQAAEKFEQIIEDVRREKTK